MTESRDDGGMLAGIRVLETWVDGSVRFTAEQPQASRSEAEALETEALETEQFEMQRSGTEQA